MSGVKVTKHGDLYRAAPASGRAITYGVSHGVFVLGTDPARVRGLGAGKPVSVPGADGALVAQANAEAIVNRAISKFRGLIPVQGIGAALLSAFTKPLGDVTLTVRAEPSGLRGKLDLGID
jgi:hypothetical protein